MDLSNINLDNRIVCLSGQVFQKIYGVREISCFSLIFQGLPGDGEAQLNDLTGFPNFQNISFDRV